jgi:multidrug efflux pump subunit AcrA (membrane-fusion protein)
MRVQSNVFAIAALTVSLIGAGCGSAANDNANANPASESVEVTTAQATLQQIPTYVEATGNLASDAQSDVAPAVGGKIV